MVVPSASSERVTGRGGRGREDSVQKVTVSGGGGVSVFSPYGTERRGTGQRQRMGLSMEAWACLSLSLLDAG
jgi:hypothetical protein